MRRIQTVDVTAVHLLEQVKDMLAERNGFLIRRGAVRIVLPISDRQTHHLGTFGRGAFFGEMAFLDGEVRSANALAFVDTELYVLSRRAFDQLADEHKKLGLKLMEGIASVLASRLRYTNAELRVLES